LQPQPWPEWQWLWRLQDEPAQHVQALLSQPLPEPEQLWLDQPSLQRP
jgi:hypothetical protein